MYHSIVIQRAIVISALLLSVEKMIIAFFDFLQLISFNYGAAQFAEMPFENEYYWALSFDI